MFKTLLSDFSRVILKPKDKTYLGGLNALHKDLSGKLGDNYNIFDYFELNEKLLGFYLSIKKDYPVNLFTTDIIQNHPQLKPRLDSIFTHIFAANDYGLNKKDPKSYAFIIEKLNFLPEEVIYIDDQEGNVEAAGKTGLTVFHYTDDDDDLIEKLSALLFE